MNPNNLIYQGDIPSKFPHLFTVNQWLWTYRNRTNNGLQDYVYILNHKGYIDLDSFPQWLESRRESSIKGAA